MSRDLACLPRSSTPLASALKRRKLGRRRQAHVLREILDLDAMLGSGQLHVVDITSYPNQHATQFISAARAGKHIIVEKPLATNTDQADELVNLAATAGKTLMVGHTFLYNAAVRYAKKLLADESLGGLDDAEMDQAADMLRKIRDELGITIIWVEHIMGVLMRVVDRVVVLDHGLRGAFWPQSVYGVIVASQWRWLEHAAWVIFEDVFLVVACLRSMVELRWS